MVTPELLSYIKQQLVTGVSEKQIKQTLSENSWKADDINEAFGYIKKKNKKLAKRKVGPMFLIAIPVVFLSFILACIFFALTQTKKVETKTTSGFETFKTNDGQRVADLLKIQKSLEDYYKQNKKYPDSLDGLSDIPKNPSGGNYSYTPIGNPANSYTLNAQMDDASDGQLSIKDGFLTIKNQQGKK